MIARFGGTCDRCERQYSVGSLIARRKGRYIHAGCAPGGDD